MPIYYIFFLFRPRRHILYTILLSCPEGMDIFLSYPKNIYISCPEDIYISFITFSMKGQLLLQTPCNFLKKLLIKLIPRIRGEPLSKPPVCELL